MRLIKSCYKYDESTTCRVRPKNVRVCMCMHVCFYIYVCEYVCILVFVCVSVCLYVCVSACLYVCLSVCMRMTAVQICWRRKDERERLQTKQRVEEES